MKKNVTKKIDVNKLQIIYCGKDYCDSKNEAEKTISRRVQ